MSSDPFVPAGVNGSGGEARGTVYRLRPHGKRLVLLNNGFPLNFAYGANLNPFPFDLVMALLLAGSIELALGTYANKRGFLNIFDELDARYIYNRLGVPTKILDLADIPPSSFNPDCYDEIPPEAKPFTDLVMQAAGLVVCVPEYNGGAPGALKWFIDLLPFPHAFEGRPVAFVGLAAGEWGGLRPVEQLRQIFGYRNAAQFPKRVFIRELDDKLDGNGGFKDEEIANRLTEQAKGFVEFIRRFKL